MPKLLAHSSPDWNDESRLMTMSPDRPDKPPQTAHSVPAPHHSADLYARIYAQENAAGESGAATVASPEKPVSENASQPAEAVASPATLALSPPSPMQLKQTGLSVVQLGELILKQLSLQGNLQGLELARQLRLRYPIVEEVLKYLRGEKYLEVANGDSLGSPTFRYQLTEAGKRRAREAFELCRYLGPAPVPLEQYVRQCQRQSVAGLHCTAAMLRKAFADLVVPSQLLEALGPAVCSGRSLFLHGPPGNGKTAVAKGLGKLFDLCGGDIYVPYAIQIESDIVTIFDPALHQTIQGDQSQDHSPESDWRWRRIKRPVVMTGGELTLEMLELRYHRLSNLYTAPLHIKANGGIFLIDDFGRQLASPSQLLNRWILPLEERVDYLTLATGKKIAIPFEQLTVFSTNLEPRQLVDDAFLRRIRHKISIDSPSRELYTEIFRRCCEHHRIPFSSEAVHYLYANYYERGKTPRSSDPRDLLEIASSICRFKNQLMKLTPELMAETSSRFFCQI